MIKTKIAVGIPTYNDHERITNLISSIYIYTNRDIDYKIVMLDDGTKDKSHVEELTNLSQMYSIPLIINSENMGIPYSWNRLTEYYDAEYMILFNDDIQIPNDKWLEAFLYFMENNDKVGVVGFSIIHMNITTGSPDKQYTISDVKNPPGRVGSPVGCCFGFRKKLWEQVRQPDGSVGYWSDLVSFYEEIDFSFELWKMGYYSYMLGYPLLEHWGSQTFANNRELSFRKFSSYLSKEEYIDIMSKAPGKLPISIEQHIELAENGKAYRMDYSRCLFAKKWGCRDFWNIPQEEVHQAYVNILPPKKVKWLDWEGKEQEKIV